MTTFFLHPWVAAAAISWKSAGITALCVLAGLLALALWAGCLWAAWLHLRRVQQVTFPLRLTSRGNVFTHFQLRVELGGLEKSVLAAWQQAGVALAPGTFKQYSYVQEALPPPAPPAQKPARKWFKKPAVPSKEQKKAKEGLQKAGMIANLVASISGLLSGLLPGAAKAPFREVNAAVRGGQQKVSAAKADVSHVQSTSRSLNYDVKRLGEAAGVKGGQAAGQPAGQPASADRARALESGQRLVVTEIPVSETGDFAPGESGLCQLVIRPRNPLRNLEGALQVTAQPVEIKEHPLYGPLPTHSLSARVKIQSEIKQRVLFASLAVVVGALCIWGASQLIGWLWLFRL